MASDYCIIIPNDFRWNGDKEAALSYLYESVKKIRHYFCSDQAVDWIDEEHYEFHLEETEVHLHSGYWEVECYCHYTQYFRKYEEGFLNREFAYEIARIFGAEEAWVCKDTHGWNSDLDKIDSTFEQWLNHQDYYEQKQNVSDVQPVELNESDFEGDNWPNLRTKYHDSFKSPKHTLTYWQAKFPDYYLLDVHPIGNFMRARKDRALWLLDIHSGMPVFNGSFSWMEPAYPCYIVYKDKQSALISTSGKKLTPYRKGSFERKSYQDKDDPNLWHIKFIDQATGEEIVDPE